MIEFLRFVVDDIRDRPLRCLVTVVGFGLLGSAIIEVVRWLTGRGW